MAAKPKTSGVVKALTNWRKLVWKDLSPMIILYPLAFLLPSLYTLRKLREHRVWISARSSANRWSAISICTCYTKPNSFILWVSNLELSERRAFASELLRTRKASYLTLQPTLKGTEVEARLRKMNKDIKRSLATRKQVTVVVYQPWSHSPNT